MNEESRDERGCPDADDRLVGGKIRKYYWATPLGERALREVRAKIEELVTEVLRDEEEVR